jgi:hypothetical protein
VLLNLSQIGQIALPTTDIERSEAFYGGVLGGGTERLRAGGPGDMLTAIL